METSKNKSKWVKSEGKKLAETRSLVEIGIICLKYTEATLFFTKVDYLFTITLF